MLINMGCGACAMASSGLCVEKKVSRGLEEG